VLANGTCNGIDIDRFCKESINKELIYSTKQSLNIKRDDFVIGFTGRLVRDKGILELVRAYQEIRKKHQNIKLMLIGMLEIRDALPEDVVRIIKEDKGIISTGYVGYDTIEKYYALMDVFVLPSYREGFPTSVLEASSMEIPVITTRVTGCCDSIIDGETGIFVGNNTKELEVAILKLYNDTTLRQRMGKAGRKFVEENFRHEIVWREIEKLYV
jgi:glycosyltransferase involved in cell wall biosynthesis